MVQCENEKCKEIYYINEPDFPSGLSDLNRKSILASLFSRFSRNNLGSSASYQNNKKIAYIFSCYKCGKQNAVDLPLNIAETAE